MTIDEKAERLLTAQAENLHLMRILNVGDYRMGHSAAFWDQADKQAHTIRFLSAQALSEPQKAELMSLVMMLRDETHSPTVHARCVAIVGEAS